MPFYGSVINLKFGEGEGTDPQTVGGHHRQKWYLVFRPEKEGKKQNENRREEGTRI